MFSVSFFAIKRAAASAPPPGAKSTNRVKGRLGADLFAGTDLDGTLTRIGQVFHVQWVGCCWAALPSVDRFAAVGGAIEKIVACLNGDE